MKFNNLVHYIWVGTKEIPTQFMLNYENAVENNPEYKFKIWREKDILPVLDNYVQIFLKGSVFHKYQLAKYMISHAMGGIYSDFDIEWKLPFKEIIQNVPTCRLVFPKRNGLYFYNKTRGGNVISRKTTMIDDFVVISIPGITKSFLDFCMLRTEHKDHPSEPFSVYALTEWCLYRKNGEVVGDGSWGLKYRDEIHFFTPEEIYDSPDCRFGYHYNKQTYNNSL